jgi:hypothetical protein
MRIETLLTGYVLRVAVYRNCWQITLLQVGTGELKTFASFEQLAAYLERHALQSGQPHCCQHHD